MGSIIKQNILRTLPVLVFLCSASFIQGQTIPTKPAHVEVPAIAPRSADVATLDGIMKAFYEVISGPAGQPRQWSRDRTLYIPGVRFVATTVRDGKVYAPVMDHQSYVEWVNDDFVRNGFSSARSIALPGRLETSLMSSAPMNHGARSMAR
jgi:hypothetical protein